MKEPVFPALATGVGERMAVWSFLVPGVDAQGPKEDRKRTTFFNVKTVDVRKGKKRSSRANREKKILEGRNVLASKFNETEFRIYFLFYFISFIYLFLHTFLKVGIKGCCRDRGRHYLPFTVCPAFSQ